MFLFSVTLTEYMSTEVAYKHRSGGIDKHTSPFFQQDETFLHLSLNDLTVCNAVFNCWQSPLPITYISRTSSNTHTLRMKQQRQPSSPLGKFPEYITIGTLVCVLFLDVCNYKVRTEVNNII